MTRRRLTQIFGAQVAAALYPDVDPSAHSPQTDTSFIDAEGTAHITRVVPLPQTVSPEAQMMLARRASDAARPEGLEQRRANTDKWQRRAGERSRALYHVNIAQETIAGVPARIVTPLTIPESNRARVLINVHGGGFNVDSGSLTETIPIANLTQTKVIAVLYRLAPEHPFPAAVDDTVAVYKELLKSYKPADIGLYGTSAGAILTAQAAVKLRKMGEPLPAALGIFSGHGDFSRVGDSQALFTLSGLSGPLEPPSKHPRPTAYAGATSLTDPVLSPVYADLHGFPATLFVTSTRDLLLSGTVTLHRAFLRAGVDARLVVFEALPHAFWNDADLPESKEAYGMMASFFDRHVGR